MAGPTLALVSTYPPTQCGLATFTAALHAQLSRTAGRVDVLRVLDGPLVGASGPEVAGILVNGSAVSTAAAAIRLNGYDTVILQHEYGIYGGPDGEDVLELVGALTVPLIVVLHTVLQDPSARQRAILDALAARADAVVTMAETGRRRLIGVYGIDPARISVIPHGAIDHGSLRVGRPAGQRPLILTWGLLGPGKGIEWAIDAVAELRDLAPRYLVAGKTHPKVLEHEGEAYRHGLEAQARATGVDDLVEIDPGYLDLAALGRLVQSADVVLLPYDSVDQVTSGVLIEAVAAGRPVVSTAFPHAVELLGGGAGIVVPQRDPEALASALRRVLAEPGLADRMAARAAQEAPALLWGAVAQRYLELAATIIADLVVAS
jgi:glycosyltransferase involved in cell wall biosynthesis